MEENELIPVDNNNAVEYTDDNIRHLSDMEHVRTRPGMYIGRLGDGAHAEDGIYVLLKEVIDNSIDEFKMQAGKKIEITVEENLRVSVRDYGRGIPQGKLIEAVSMLNTGGKYDSKAFKKSVGLNGVGVKAVNALSSRFEVRSYRDGKVRIATFSKGNLLTDETQNTEEENGTYIFFEPDNTLFLNYCFKPEFIETMLRNYTYLNTGLAIIYNGHRILSRNGLVDLLNDNMTATGLYPIIHLKGEDIEIAFTHTGQYGEEYYSFVNGQHTTQGGTHQSAFKEHIARTIKEFFNKNMDYTDIRNGLVAAIAVNVEEPIFESQTKTKLGSTNMVPGGVTVNKYVGDFIKLEVDNFLHKNADVAEAIQQKIQESEKERKAIAGVTKLARERAKKANLHNRKLRDCRVHLNDPKGKGLEEEPTIASLMDDIKYQQEQTSDSCTKYYLGQSITYADSAQWAQTHSLSESIQAQIDAKFSNQDPNELKKEISKQIKKELKQKIKAKNGEIDDWRGLMKEIGTTLARQDSLRMATLGREANKQDSTISEIRKNILANMAQQDNPYEDQDIWNDLSEAGSEMKNVFNEMTNNYFTENSFLSAVGNLMKSWIHGNKAFSILALLPLFTISTRLSFCRTSIGRRLNLTENFFAQVYIACQILWISLLILPFTGTAHLNDIFDLSYKAIFILFVWDYRQLFGLSWWKSFCRTIIMFWYCFLGLLLVCSIIIGIIVLIAYIIQWGK